MRTTSFDFSMVAIRSYRDLIVWQKSIELAIDLHAATRRFPSSERFGLASRIQRAGVSIPSNIAEGHARDGVGHYLNHLTCAGLSGRARDGLDHRVTDRISACGNLPRARTQDRRDRPDASRSERGGCCLRIDRQFGETVEKELGLGTTQVRGRYEVGTKDLGPSP